MKLPFSILLVIPPCIPGPFVLLRLVIFSGPIYLFLVSYVSVLPSPPLCYCLLVFCEIILSLPFLFWVFLQAFWQTLSCASLYIPYYTSWQIAFSFHLLFSIFQRTSLIVSKFIKLYVMHAFSYFLTLCHRFFGHFYFILFFLYFIFILILGVHGDICKISYTLS